MSRKAKKNSAVTTKSITKAIVKAEEIHEPTIPTIFCSPVLRDKIRYNISFTAAITGSALAVSADLLGCPWLLATSTGATGNVAPLCSVVKLKKVTVYTTSPGGGASTSINWQPTASSVPTLGTWSRPKIGAVATAAKMQMVSSVPPKGSIASMPISYTGPGGGLSPTYFTLFFESASGGASVITAYVDVDYEGLLFNQNALITGNYTLPTPFAVLSGASLQAGTIYYPPLIGPLGTRTTAGGGEVEGRLQL